MTDDATSLLNYIPPEYISDAVGKLLHEIVDAAIENWNEGYWSDYRLDTSRADVLRDLAGYIDAVLDGDLEEYAEPIVVLEPEA